MDKVIPALIVAAISALTVFAYKHPNGFKPVFMALAVGFAIFFCASMAWDLGVNFTYQALIRFVGSDKIKEAVIATDFSTPVWVILSAFGVYLYLCFLRFVLPWLLEEDKPTNK